MNTLEFINQYYKSNDSFFVGILDRTTNKYNQYKHNLKTIKQNINKLTYHNNNNKDIYLSLNTYNDSFKRTKTNISSIKSIFFDIDKDAAAIKNKIINIFGTPTFLIQTSLDKFQLIYQLKEPLDNTNIERIENVGHILSNHFKTDKTFDTTRIFRAPLFINNKNGFKVEYTYNEVYYKLDIFENYIKDNNLKSESKESITIKTSINDDLIKNNKYNSNNKFFNTYQKLVSKANNDKNIADIKFIKYLLHKKMKRENIIKNLIEVRQDIFSKHKDINNYIETTFNKIYIYEPDLIKY